MTICTDDQKKRDPLRKTLYMHAIVGLERVAALKEGGAGEGVHVSVAAIVRK